MFASKHKFKKRFFLGPTSYMQLLSGGASDKHRNRFGIKRFKKNVKNCASPRSNNSKAPMHLARRFQILHMLKNSCESTILVSSDNYTRESYGTG
jgi:hypothetical protein